MNSNKICNTSEVIDAELLKRLDDAHRFFSHNNRYRDFVDAAQRYFEAGDNDSAWIELKKLPSDMDLLQTLTEKLEAKSVYKTLQKIVNDTVGSKYEILKGIFSLGTHIVIECENGNKEYAILLGLIYEKLGRLIYSLDE